MSKQTAPDLAQTKVFVTSQIIREGTHMVSQTNEMADVDSLTLWRRNYFFLILAHPVYKMWIIQVSNKLALWNKLHLKRKKTESIEHV